MVTAWFTNASVILPSDRLPFGYPGLQPVQKLGTLSRYGPMCDIFAEYFDWHVN